MQPSEADRVILDRFRRALGEAYGSKLERVVLCGSRARGDARPDSDYDIAVFIHEPEGFWLESRRLAEIETDLLDDTGAVINTMPFRAGAYNDRTGLMMELRRDAIDLRYLRQKCAGARRSGRSAQHADPGDNRLPFVQREPLRLIL